MTRRFCALCGRSEDEVRLVGNICVECFVKTYGLVAVPRLRPIPMCRVCGAVFVGGRWVDAGGFEEAVEAVMRGVVSRSLRPSRPEASQLRVESYRVLGGPSWTTPVEIEASAVVAGVRVSERRRLVIRFKPSVCPRCATYRSGEYAAVVQVRGRGAEKAVEEVLARMGRRVSSLIEVVSMHGGLDVYFDEVGAARRMARMLAGMAGARVAETEETVGTDRSGRRRARKTILVRLG